MPPGKPTWSVGDQALAKYWEDGRYYPTKITAVGPSTAVVLFTEYDNYEEVLISDLMPVRGKGRKNIAPTPGLPSAFGQ